MPARELPPGSRAPALISGLRFTRDPFDALICAAAQVIDLPLITRDAAIRGSGTVKVIW